MALTKEDIESAIAQTENQDAIRHSLSNYFEDLDKPVAVAIGIGRNRWDRDMHPENVDKVVDLLRSKGIDAVSFLDPQAVRSDKFVVNESGVLCPFMSPQDSLKAATLIEDAVLNNDYRIVGHINPQTAENILYTSKESIKIKNDSAELDQGINLKEAHPDSERFNEIEKKYGGDYKSFIDRKINEAYVDSKIVDFNVIDADNVYGNGMAELYRGGTLGANPYATVSQWNSRKVAHSSPAISICAGFCGKGKTKSSRGGAVYEKTLSGLEYGFIYKLESMGDKQQFYHNVGLETGDNPRTKNEVDYNIGESYDPWNGHNGQIYESPILPHHNKLKEIYIYVGKKGETEEKLYPIPLDENGKIADQEWKDFMALHEPTDDKVIGYLKERQDTQKREQTEDLQHAYGFELKENLDADNQKYLETISPRDFLLNFVHDNDIEQTTGGILVNKLSDANSGYSSVNMEDLRLKSFPDLSDVKIIGSFVMNVRTISEIDATKLPECTQGISLNGIDIKNVSALSADKFLNIIGAGTQKEPFENYFGVQTGNNNRISCDGMPLGWDKLKFKELPSGVDLVYDSIDKVPETLRGIGISGVSIKDQSSIENMSATDFIYKINGNLGTDARHIDISVLYSQGIHHTDIHDNININLNHTNISTMPSELKNYTVNSIIMNSNATVNSLDNFPVTKEGIYGLNFNGDLKNETMESFLLKTKGKEWVENNTSKSADGHLIINDDFDFRTQKYSNYDNVQMNITSFPKDILDVEFMGKIEPSELNYQLSKLKNIDKQKDSENVIITSGTIDLDLSAYKIKNLTLDKNSQQIILPQSLEQLDILNNPNFDMSAIEQIPQGLKSISFSNISTEKPLDLSFMDGKDIAISESDLAEVKLPEKTAYVKLQNTNQKATKISGVEELSAKNTNFQQGVIIDLSESKRVSFDNCSFPEGTILDFSKCELVDLNNLDLSNVKVIAPKQGKININENVKFAPDYKLDLSNCAEGFVHHSVECAEVKLPQKIITDSMDKYILPKQATEISTSCIAESYCKFNISQQVKIIDTPGKNGKKIPLKYLKSRGLSEKQIFTLRKERILAPIKKCMAKIMPFKTNHTQNLLTIESMIQRKQTICKVNIQQQDKEKIAALSGRKVTKSDSAKAVEETALASEMFKEPDIQQKIESQEPTAVLGQPQGKIANMDKKEKENFLKNLRNGFNSIMPETETPTAADKTISQTQTKAQINAQQQPNLLQANSSKGNNL